MRLPHCIAFFITYLGLLMSMDKKLLLQERKAMQNRMRKLDVATWLIARINGKCLPVTAF